MRLQYLIINALLINFSCSNLEKKQIQSEVEDKTIEEKPSHAEAMNSDARINIKDELDKPHGGNYLVSLNDSTLSIVGLSDLYNPFASNRFSDFEKTLIDYKVKVNSDSSEFEFSNGGSYLQLYYWSTNELTAEYTEPADTLMKGNITQDSLAFPCGIVIGMNRKTLLSKFFSDISDFTVKIKQLNVWRDERGDIATIYRFENNKLESIEFGAI